jgi:IclR family acetate operon transcriptional repressor
MNERESNPVRSIQKAAAILDLLAESKQPLSLTEIAEQTGWAKSTAYGLLCSMRSVGFVEQSAETGRYTLGVRLFEYGSAVQSTRNILTLSREPMHALVEASGESAVLSMLDRGEVLILGHAEPDSSFHIVSETGRHLPSFCTAQGKILLSEQPVSSVRRIFEAHVQAFTPHTATSYEQLATELASVRETGFAIENGEFRVGIRGVAAPIRDHHGEIRYAIGLIGMFRRVDSDEFRAATAHVKETAETLSAMLGYRKN